MTKNVERPRCYDVCQPPKQEGEITNPTECDEGLDCEEGVCVDVSFAATFTAGNGLACNPFDGTLCGPNLYCAFSATGPTCKPIGTEGQSCSRD